MASVRIFKKFDLEGIHNDIMGDVKDGIEAACAETTSWIKQDVLLGQKYVGNADFPDVSAATQALKRKKGQRHVLISTGHLKDSWNFEVRGLEGKVVSGHEGYFEKIYSKWKIDQLWQKHHADESREIIKKAVSRNL